jgi:hypothetical protein
MTNIFVSRPTWVELQFKRGLEAFLRLLETMKLAPRTLGAGKDRPSKSPLDEVIALMDECQGAIILGYPQVTATSGRCKDRERSEPLVLATEWNHIETGLAYAKGLPLLTIHHSGVTRGVFDRGAINSFIHEVDMADSGWSLSEQISGALEKWTSNVVKNPYRGALLDGHGERKPLADDQIAILQSAATDPYCRLGTLVPKFGISPQKARYHVEQLASAGLLEFDEFDPMMSVRLTPEGRAALFERDLL